MWVRRLIVYYLLSANPDPDDDPEANASVGVGVLSLEKGSCKIKSRVATIIFLTNEDKTLFRRRHS